jgi:hypothetical protein
VHVKAVLHPRRRLVRVIESECSSERDEPNTVVDEELGKFFDGLQPAGAGPVLREAYERGVAAGIDPLEIIDRLTSAYVDGLQEASSLIVDALESDGPRMLAEHRDIRLGF